MKSKKYLNIAEHYEACLDKYGDTHRGVDWPNEDDMKVRYRVMLDLIQSKEPLRLLDFGCGTANLLQYINDHDKLYSHINYEGSDISEKFIKVCKDKFPKNSFYCFDIMEDKFPVPYNFDYAILNGVFTEKRELTNDEMWAFFSNVITKIFNHVDKGIAFNVMSKAVDWEREDLYHLSTDALIDFLTKSLSRNFVIRNDYGLYEYTVYLYK
ncbi:MAG: class I SAM-dependent methyltransferase [Flavobacterium sp.]|nr:MAG: class I SAM-dependent methyltransferase [Flavobacterium sp.]